jgi:RNA polymerase sigma-70 factor (ECF subfamily)
MCRRRVGDETLAEDIAQETLTRALTHRDAFDDRRPAWPWLKTIATNLIVDHYRKHVRETTLEAEHGEATQPGPAVEEADLLRRAIQQLPRRQRAAVALRYLNDWDAHDAASFMGVTRPAYEQLLFRARRRLKMEYRRLSQEVSGGIAAGITSLRGLFRRAAHKAREAGSANPTLVQLTSIGGTQLANGAVALAIALGTPALAPGSVAGSPALARTRATAAHALPRADHESARPTRAKTPASTGAAVSAPWVPATEAEGNTFHNAIPRITSQDVVEPEDTHITSIALAASPDGPDYAAGQGECPSELCPAVLFESRDGGATWNRLAAQAFDGESLLVPTGSSPDGPIFAMGRLGLQVSRDGGGTFTAAVPGGAPFTIGSAAISPAFSAGDPTILIGAQTLMRYRDDLGVVEPAPWATGSGPLQPAFAPSYPSDDRVMVGGFEFNPARGGLTSAVHTCRSGVCSHAFVGDLAVPVKIRMAPDFQRSNVAYAFTEEDIHVTTDGGATFTKVPTAWAEGTIKDVAIGSADRLFAAVEGRDAGGLYVSDDRGTSWSASHYEPFGRGVSAVTISGDRIMAALSGHGFACSIDGGATWAARCAPRS